MKWLTLLRVAFGGSQTSGGGIVTGGSYFGNRYFGRRYFGDRFFK